MSCENHYSEGGLHDLSRKVLERLKKNNENIVLISGDLGAGKTSFARNFAHAFGITNVKSPTYTIECRYPLVDRRWNTLVHIDCYRLDGDEDAETVDLFATVQDAHNLCIIEWPEKVPALEKIDAVRIKLKETDDKETRKISID
jgi:tRNA threonylcarbamoyladenosine biosynthesis protein TsaE